MSLNAAAAPQNIFDKLFSPGHYDVQNVVLAHCSPASLFNLAKTCRFYRAALLPQFSYLWDINRHLRRFFSDPVAFRSLQARTATLISGSSALQFLDRTVYEGSDLDLYVREQCVKEVWVRIYPQVQQDPDLAVALATIPPSLYNIWGVHNIIDLEHPSDGRKIQVISAETCPIEVVLHFHSTCVMNVISFSHAYSLYPTATFEHRTSLMCAKNGSLHITAQQKYRERGWTLLPSAPDVQFETDLLSAFSAVPRWIADRFAWVLPLDMDGIVAEEGEEEESIRLNVDPIMMTSWSLGLWADEYARAVYGVLRGQSRNCKYSYITADAGFWNNYVYWYGRRALVKAADPDVHSLRLDSTVIPIFERYQKALTTAIHLSAKSISGMTEAVIDALPKPVTTDAMERIRQTQQKRMESIIHDLTRDAQMATSEGLGEFREDFAWYTGWWRE